MVKKRKYEPLPVLAEDIKLFEYLKEHSFKDAATFFHSNENALRTRKSRAVRRIEACQDHVNQIYSMRKHSERLRHLTNSPEIESSEENNE